MTGPACRLGCVEPLAINELLPEMPLMLTKDSHIKVPLEPVYTESWEHLPEAVKQAVAGGTLGSMATVIAC